jgi:DUF4097 and DUF4098 domain-containing protein YvlB
MPLAGLLMTALGVASASAEDRTFDKRFPGLPGGTLTVDTDYGGVSISGTDANDVVIRAAINGDHHLVDAFEIEAVNSDDGVMVKGRRAEYDWVDLSWMFGRTLEVRFTIEVPRTYHVQVRSSRGDLELRNFNGKAYAQTSRGNVEVIGINGQVDINTSRGNVRGSGITGNVNLVTSRGKVTLEKVDGSINVRSSRGDIDVELAGANRGADVNSSRGDVIVRLPKQFAADLDVRTSRGEVECDLPVSSRSQSSSNRHQTLSGTVNGGGKLLKIETSRGDIDIRSGS